MSALNSKETAQLQDAQTVMHNAALLLKGIEEKVDGMWPDSQLQEIRAMRVRLKSAEDDVKTVKVMKGHYPS